MVVYANGRGWRVRIAQAAVWAGFLTILWVAYGLPPNPNDGPADRWVAAGGTAFMALCAIGMEIYLRLYVICMTLEQDHLVVTSLATLHHRRRRLPLADLYLGRLRRDLDPAYGIDNQWSGLSVRGRPAPMVLDLTGPELFDRGGLEAAIRAAGRKPGRGG